MIECALRLSAPPRRLVQGSNGRGFSGRCVEDTIVLFSTDNGARWPDGGWPLIINLRSDPYEVSPDSANYTPEFYAGQVWALEPAAAVVEAFLESFKKFPPAAGSPASVERVLEQLTAPPRQ